MVRSRGMWLAGALALGIAVLCGRAEPPAPDAAASCEEGIAHYRAGRLEEAVACFDRAIEADPRCARAHLGRCWARGAKRDEKGRYDWEGELSDAVKALELRKEGAPIGPCVWKVQRSALEETDLTGTYILYRADDPDEKPNQVMTITAQRGGQFLIGGLSLGWEGRGAVRGRSGVYDFVFADGRSGRNAFTIEKEGTLYGRVQGSGTKNEWHYRAWRVEGEIRLPGR